METLPNELILHITNFLDLKSLSSLGQISILYYSILIPNELIKKYREIKPKTQVLSCYSYWNGKYSSEVYYVHRGKYIYCNYCPTIFKKNHFAKHIYHAHPYLLTNITNTKYEKYLKCCQYNKIHYKNICNCPFTKYYKNQTMSIAPELKLLKTTGYNDMFSTMRCNQMMSIVPELKLLKAVDHKDMFSTLKCNQKYLSIEDKIYSLDKVTNVNELLYMKNTMEQITYLYNFDKYRYNSDSEIVTNYFDIITVHFFKMGRLSVNILFVYFFKIFLFIF